LAKPRPKTEAILKTYELLINEVVHYKYILHKKKTLQIATQYRTY